MKPSSSSLSKRKGFTLVELLVALAITAIIVSMLVTITATALQAYSSSRNRVTASREAKAAIDQLSRDLESLVVRSGNNFDWLWASSQTAPPGPSGNTSPNASRAVFFTAATDRYNGQLNTAQDAGGDVSTVAYQLLFRDPVADNENQQFSTFILYRQLINPDDTFSDLLGSNDLESAYRGSPFQSNLSNPGNFVCENIYEFSLSFVVEFEQNNTTVSERVLVLNSGGAGSVGDFRINGSNIITDGNTNSAFANGRIAAADISITVINNNALEVLRNGGLPDATKDTFIEKNSFHYSKTIILPQP